MEEKVVQRADVLIAVSETLQNRLQCMGRASHLLTHGVDLPFWQTPAAKPMEVVQGLKRPLILFWGVIDRRMDVSLVARLGAELSQGTIVLLGPEVDPDPQLFRCRGVVHLPPLPIEQLPMLAGEAAVLVMPYADLPVTRAMQPLKLKEYLATGKPVVVRDLPATRPWADCLDLVSTPESFVDAVRLRLNQGVSEEQDQARCRLSTESWQGKAYALESWASRSGNGSPDEQSLPMKQRFPHRPVILDVRVVTQTGGGPDKTILNQPRFLEPAGYRNVCAYLHPPGDAGFEQLRRRAQTWGAPLVAIPDRGPLDWRVAPALLRVCCEEKVAIWHGHDYKTNFLGLFLRRFWPMRLVTTVHGYGVKETPRTRLYNRLDLLWLRYFEQVISVSPDLHDTCRKCGVPENRCILIENAIDTTEFQRRQSIPEAKAKIGWPADRLLVGAVGRLSEEKGFHLLIRAVDQLIHAGLDVGLILVGEGEQRPQLEALASQLGCGDRVRLLGFQSDTRSLYEAMDVYALSSFREGLPNVILEAMAMEVPVVATRIAGVPRLINHGVNGLLVNPGSAEELAGALHNLLTDRPLREHLRQAGRQTITSHYSFARRMDRIRAIYDTLLEWNREGSIPTM